MSVYGQYVVGLLSVWVRDCRSAVGYDSSIVLMIGFQSVPCRLSIGLKSGDSTLNLSRNDPDVEPDWLYGVFSNIVGDRQLADSLKILHFLSVSYRIGRCDWGISHFTPQYPQLTMPFHSTTIFTLAHLLPLSLAHLPQQQQQQNLNLLCSITKALLTHTLASFWRKQSCNTLGLALPGAPLWPQLSCDCKARISEIKCSHQ